MFCRYGKEVKQFLELSFLNLKTTFVLSCLNLKITFGGGIVVSNTILQNHWRFSHNTPRPIRILLPLKSENILAYCL